MNSKIINEFNKLIKQIKTDIDTSYGREQNINTFRLSSTEKVLQILKDYPKKIKSSEQLKDIKGIGKNSLKRIDEIINTGKLKEIKNINNINENYFKSIDDLTSIFGIGEIKAKELIKKYKIKNVEDLKKLILKKKIELPENILKGIKYKDKIKKNIPRNEIDKIYLYLLPIVKKFDKNLNLMICGSYRRMKKTSNDIDVLLYHNNIITKKESNNSNVMNNFIKKLIKEKFIVDNFTSLDVPTKFMGICKYKTKPIRRIDIRLIPYESIYTAMLYFTGSRDFNKKMRLVAIKNNFILNEYSLFNKKTKRKMKIKSEKHIFELLNMKYLKPELRK